MKEYVLGFIYVGDDRILLQEKNRGGKYLEGKLNGLGGKIEETDNTPKNAMQREYVEETGDAQELPWQEFGTLTFDGNVKLNVFFAHVSDDFYDDFVFNSTDPNAEKLFIIKKSELDWDKCVYNLRYLLPLMAS